jgi:hypothetical protein
MTGTNDITEIHRDDLVVVVVGLTATWPKRRRARRYFARAFPSGAYVPWIPYFLGLRASAAWLSHVVRRRLRRGPHKRLHLVAYIGGGILVRQLHDRGEQWPIGRAVWDRGPLQEQVAPRLVARVSPILLTLIGFRSVVDLSRIGFSLAPFPPSPQGAGLIVETRASALARRLKIDRDMSSELVSGSVEALLPGATAAIALSLSHDDVYDDPRFLDQAAHFIKTGSFLEREAEVLR